MGMQSCQKAANGLGSSFPDHSPGRWYTFIFFYSHTTPLFEEAWFYCIPDHRYLTSHQAKVKGEHSILTILAEGTHLSVEMGHHNLHYFVKQESAVISSKLYSHSQF